MAPWQERDILSNRLNRRLSFHKCQSESVILKRSTCPLELTPPQFRILNYLLVAPGASLSEVAAYLGVRLPTASVMLVKLAAEGYVLRSRHPTSRRRMQLVLTERGQEITVSVRTALFSRLRAGLDRLEAAECMALQDAMPALRRLFAQV